MPRMVVSKLEAAPQRQQVHETFWEFFSMRVDVRLPDPAVYRDAEETEYSFRWITKLGGEAETEGVESWLLVSHFWE